MKATNVNSVKLRDFNYARSLEWIETNGLGGYASSTVSGAHSRRYHGLLIASFNPPVERSIVLSKLEETIVNNEQRFELSSNQYPGAIHPEGFKYLKSFDHNMFPVFEYEVGNIIIKKTIAAVHGENTTLILYEVLSSDTEFVLELLPLASFRDYHHLSHATDSIYKGYIFEDGLFETKNYHNSSELFISVPESDFKSTPHWYYNFEYSMEQLRGMEFQEDLFTHGNFFITLKQGSKLGVIISTDSPNGRDAFQLFNQEKLRREGIIKQYDTNKDIQRLLLSADQFVVKRGSDLKTIIAGYHWFSDWGRDTMISLPGLCLVTGRFEDAKKILKAFAESISEGMLPNRFPDTGEKPEYNTSDATLWFFNAIYKYYQYTSDKTFIVLLIPVLKDIMDWHYKGTHYNICVDSGDELLYAGEDGVQLTWMDAKVDGWVVTPRKGKAVEINALWYNALCIMVELLAVVDEMNESAKYKEKALRVHTHFNHLFWNESKKYLYDFIDGEYKNDDLRPNQIFAISLPFQLLEKERAIEIFKVITEKLLTPRGLRSLSPSHKGYKANYVGDRWLRDGAYHQGTVWSFLIGPYIDTLIKIKGAQGKTEAVLILTNFFTHLNEAGMGTISEIFDAEPPHHPRGCIAQAWGVAEILRVIFEHDLALALSNKKQKESR